MKRSTKIAGMIAALLLWPLVLAAEADYAPVVKGQALEFPRDHGSHPTFRTEWWYVTGWLEDSQGKPLGFQITFFRTRPGNQQNNPSRFAARQILVAHAALADPAKGKLIHDQRMARAGFGLAEAAEGDTDVHVDDWRFTRDPGGYSTHIPARDFSLDLTFDITQPPLLQGEAGFSQKAADPRSASYYYSSPQLKVSGSIRRAGRDEQVQGTAWLDHEWSSEYLPHGAAGWDWIGINMDNGGALMAFRMRGKDGVTLWAGGAHRGPDGKTAMLHRDQITFTPRHDWRSPLTGTAYPVACTVRAGDLQLDIEPLMENQELDARNTTGTIYWEGAVRARSEGRAIGKGYLELTGYWKPMKL